VSSTSTKLFIGVDPGKGGAIVALRFRPANKGYAISAAITTLNKHDYELCRWMEDVLDSSDVNAKNTNVYAIVEKVGGYMGTGETGGKNKASGHTMFTFGESSGACKMLLACFGVPRELVLPKTWQGKVGMTGGKKKGESQSAWKNRLKARAMEIYPSLGKITLAVADAFLIAHYCRMTRAGILE
jgi:hypothetical protein